MNLTTLRQRIELVYKKWRSLHYYVESDVFKFLYDKASEQEKKELANYILNGDKEYIKKFVRKRKDDLDEFQKLGIRKLREICKHLGIKNTSRMNKASLIREIEDEVHRIKEDTDKFISEP